MSRPNVILFMTDDQGYGDLGFTGNPWIHTPNLDAFADEAIGFSDFHVSPLCAPTRGALLTGRRPSRNGVWGVCRGRSLLKPDEVTLADVFAGGGYRTGMFGKWHLGDNYPYRPHERGFARAIYHKGGGVGQTPDHWGNNYFDDTYFHNADPVDHDGYCTDIWFDEAMRFIDDCDGDPFFVYLSTNAPHDPYLVEDRYTAPYADNEQIPNPAFYGMIANLDANFARLRSFLSARGLEEDTILIFLTDNGSSGGCVCDEKGFVTRGYNANMRGKKGSYYDGGHRVPLLVRWPEGGVQGGRRIDEMALHVDLLPTLMDLCGLEHPAPDRELDGTSLAGLLQGRAEQLPEDRTHFVQFDMAARETLDKWTVGVMTRRWRLIHGRELYDIQADPEQRSDVACRHPEVVERLRQAHETWWQKVEPGLAPYCPVVLGSDAENPARLDAFDVLGDVVYVQSLVAQGKASGGKWAVEFQRPGRYRFELRRWPEELDWPMDADISPEAFEKLIIHWPGSKPARVVPKAAQITLSGQTHQFDVDPTRPGASIELEVQEAGATTLEAYFLEDQGQKRGAYYVYVHRL
jgi:arylsulfatase A-like enzyme